MAKQKKQLTPLQQAFKKEYKRIMNAVHRAEKKGYIFDTEKLPQVPQRITHRSVTKLQKIKPIDLRKKAQKLDYETGELISGRKAVKLEKQQAKEKAKETRQRNWVEKEIQKNRKAEPFDIDYYDKEYYIKDKDEETYYEPEPEPEPEPITTEDGYTIDLITGEIISTPEPIHERDKYNKEHGLDKYKGKQEEKRTEPKKDTYKTFPEPERLIIDVFLGDCSQFPTKCFPKIKAWVDRLINSNGEKEVGYMLEQAKQSGIWITRKIAYDDALLDGMMSDMMDFLPDTPEWIKNDIMEDLQYGESYSEPE